MTDPIAHYRMMLLIRFFEERVEQLFTQGVIRGTTHPAIGQEAVAVGVCAGLAEQDYVTSTHRGHAHFIARGGDPRRIMAELFGKQAGYSRGRGGSQFMADFSIGFLGANGITGGSIPTATGVALSCKLRRTHQVAICFFGDGAANQGTCHESLNLAGIWKLPVVYVCENNQYAMSMPVQASVSIANIADRAAGYGFPGVVVDGNDVLAVQAATEEACERARNFGEPTLIECKTYRLSGHSRGDQCRYRSRGEEATAKENCPVRRLKQVLVQRGGLTETEDERLREQAHAVVADAEQFAEQSPYPEPETLTEGLFATG